MASVSETGMNLRLPFLPEKLPSDCPGRAGLFDSVVEATAPTVVSCGTQPIFSPAVFEIEPGPQGKILSPFLLADRHLFCFFRWSEVKVWSIVGSGKPRPWLCSWAKDRVAEVQRALSAGVAAGPRKGGILSRQGEAG